MRNQPKKEVNKIELIDFKDPKKFANVAYLLDREDFLKEVLQFRDRLRKQTRVLLPLQWEPGTQWDSELWNPLSLKELDELDKQFRKAAKSYLIATVDDAVTEEVKIALELTIRKNPSEGFLLDVKELRKKYHQSLLMEKVIAKAVIYNEVHEEDYPGCYVEILSPTLDFFFNYDEPALVIVIDPTTRAEDLKQVYDEQLSKMQTQYKKIGMALDYDVVGEREKPRIILHREWYWLSKMGYSPREILETCPIILRQQKYKDEGSNIKPNHNEDICIYCLTVAGYDAIDDAIKEYPKWLNYKSEF